MRRIATSGKPSGWKCAAPQHATALSSARCAAPLSAIRSAARNSCANSLRFYSHASFRLPPSKIRGAPSGKIADPSYKPALSSEGLSTVGGLEDWWERRTNWSKSGDFAGFKAKKKIQDQRVLETAVRRAVTEVTVLKQGGRHKAEWVGTWPVGTEEELARVLALEIQCDAEGSASLAGDYTAVAEDLTWDIQEARQAERPATDAPEQVIALPSTEEASAYIASWDPSWKQVSLADPVVKFAVSKRIFQLTGQFIPDHKSAGIDTVSTLLAALRRPEKAKTLADDIQKTRQDLVDLANVVFSPKQVTRGDKAKAIGRFKIIEEEFKKRDLQGGHLAVPASKEKHWFRGEA